MAPQINQVVLCVVCKSYQVQLVKKEKKWECKVCRTKQSLIQVYGTGTGAECRQFVLKLNEARGLLEQQSREESSSKLEKSSSPEEKENEESEDNYQFRNKSQPEQGKGSKWEVYLENPNQNLY